MRSDPSGFELEHDLDPRDDAEAFVTLDGREVVVCSRCEREVFSCSCCPFCGASPRCVCEPISDREMRAAAARYDGAPARRRRP